MGDIEREAVQSIEKREREMKRNAIGVGLQ